MPRFVTVAPHLPVEDLAQRRRSGGAGRPAERASRGQPLLTLALRDALAEALDGPAPDGGVWTLVNEPVANRTFADLDDLTDVLVARCQALRADRRRIKAHTDHHWWAVDVGPGNIRDHPDSV